MDWLAKIVNKPQRVVIGLMSGTSMDGIDAALVKINGSGPSCSVELVDFICVPYERDIVQKLSGINRDFSLSGLSDLNFTLGRIFSSAVRQLMKKNGLSRNNVDIIGTHGQTVFHNPQSAGNNTVSTLQIGEADIIAGETGVTTVSDFRTRDMAAGGEGAPLIPYVDYILFHREGSTPVAQNIGGISNLTVVTELTEDIVAFDTGPGNSLIDHIVSLHTHGKMSYDENGDIAASGSVDFELLEKLMGNGYFMLEPPKSTGKEVFGPELGDVLYRIVRQNKMSFQDLVSTLTQFTVDSIVLAYEKFVFPRFEVEEIILSGGGARNGEMVRRLETRLPERKITLSDDYGIPAEAKEAVGFAILANETITGNPGNIPSVTGASKASPLGKISVCN